MTIRDVSLERIDKFKTWLDKLPLFVEIIPDNKTKELYQFLTHYWRDRIILEKKDNYKLEYVDDNYIKVPCPQMQKSLNAKGPGLKSRLL